MRRQAAVGRATPAGSSRDERLDPFALPVQFVVSDKAADERVRNVELTRERVVVRRAVNGIKMAVNLPIAAYLIAVVVEVGGSLLLAVGYRTTFVATGMAVFTLATAVFFHNHFADQNQFIHFFKNIAIAGGLFQIASFGAGSISIDGLRTKTYRRGSALSPA